ncbi:hypothetical protein [Aestuariivirga sp.]|uniref:hypothetical protein n=1 Tax=Aestuariivirga sp. TaxID=2650926 RepID=UPI0035931F5D
MTLKPDMSNELRTMVRDMLREVMAGRALPATGTDVQRVRISNDHELAAFVARVIEPQTLEKLKSGKLRFTLGNAPAVSISSPSAEALTGVVTEQKIDALKGAAKLVLAPGAVLTPLARDKARKLGLAIERRR